MRLGKMLARRWVVVGAGLMMADAVLLLMLHGGMFAPGKDFALGLIIGVNLGVVLYGRLLVLTKRNFPD